MASTRRRRSAQLELDLEPVHPEFRVEYQCKPYNPNPSSRSTLHSLSVGIIEPRCANCGGTLDDQGACISEDSLSHGYHLTGWMRCPDSCVEGRDDYDDVCSTCYGVGLVEVK